jgi:hypothetical protein
MRKCKGVEGERFTANIVMTFIGTERNHGYFVPHHSDVLGAIECRSVRCRFV